MARHILTDFEIPDTTRPIPESARGFFGASGELVPFIPTPVTDTQVLGRRVFELSTHVGTYGMGGPGFFGLLLDPEWLVVAVWGAASWIHCDGRMVEDHFFVDQKRARPWITLDGDELSPKVVGSKINAFQVSARALSIGLSSGFELAIEESPQNRPILEGSKGLREFSAQEDLRQAVFLSPTAEIWV
jgi:hypothetical protein